MKRVRGSQATIFDTELSETQFFLVSTTAPNFRKFIPKLKFIEHISKTAWKVIFNHSFLLSITASCFMKSVLTRKFYSRKVLKLKTYFNLQYGNENQGLVV